MNPLLQAYTLNNGVEIRNRLVVAPMTHLASDDNGQTTAEELDFIRPRACGMGMFITAATAVSQNGRAFPGQPNAIGAQDLASLKQVAAVIRAQGAKAVLQLHHGGDQAQAALIGSEDIITASASKRGREMNTAEIKAIVAAFGNATALAIAAGFDGVEVHGANGYLLDEFLRDGSNKRSGPYGGPREHRARLLFEVIEAACKVWGSGRVGVRLSPLNSYNDMVDSDPVGLIEWLAGCLNDYRLAYLHLMRGDFFGQQHGDVMTPARAAFRGVLIGNMGYGADEANAAIAAGQLDAVAFGTAFLANPDLPARIKAGAQLNSPNPDTFYSPGAEGYTDYPFMH